jgi:PAS domain S-box-containing protein
MIETHHKELALCLFKEANDAFLVFRLDDYRVMDVNPAAQRMSGYRRKQLLGMTLRDLFNSNTEQTIENMIASFQSSGISHAQDVFSLKQNNGGKIPINVSVSRLHTKPEPLGLVTVRDISNRTNVETILWSLAMGVSTAVGPEFFPCLVQHLALVFNARYSIVAEHLDSPVTRVRTLGFWMGDKLGENIEYDITGTPCEKTIHSEMAFYPTNVQQLFPKDHDLIKLGMESYCGVSLKNSSGKTIGHLAVLDTKAMEENLCEQPSFQIFVARAAAELERRVVEDQAQQIQAQLEHVCRVSSMGEMASALAHEINQPLGAIANNAQACLRGIRNETLDLQEVLSALEEMTAEAFRASEIIRRLRKFISRKTPMKSTVNVNELIQEVVRLLEFDARNHDVNLLLDLDETIPQISIDRIQIQQVLVNLLRNAFEAMNDLDVIERRVTVRSSFESGEVKVKVSVSDRGKGIPQKDIKHAFDPYVTTKPDGLGMGLCISHSIIEWHSGRFFGKRNSGPGMTFVFTLPSNDNSETKL